MQHLENRLLPNDERVNGSWDAWECVHEYISVDLADEILSDRIWNNVAAGCEGILLVQDLSARRFPSGSLFLDP